jgi:hypothetical protein
MPRLTADHVLAAVGALLNMKQGKNTRDAGSLMYLCDKFDIPAREAGTKRKKSDLIMTVLSRQLTLYWDRELSVYAASSLERVNFIRAVYIALRES